MAKKKEIDQPVIEEQLEVQGGSPEAEVTELVPEVPPIQPLITKVEQDLPVKGIFKRQVIKQGVFRLSAGDIDGMNSTDKDWVIELMVHGRKVYILSEVTYNKSL